MVMVVVTCGCGSCGCGSHHHSCVSCCGGSIITVNNQNK